MSPSRSAVAAVCAATASVCACSAAANASAAEAFAAFAASAASVARSASVVATSWVARYSWTASSALPLMRSSAVVRRATSWKPSDDRSAWSRSVEPPDRATSRAMATSWRRASSAVAAASVERATASSEACWAASASTTRPVVGLACLLDLELGGVGLRAQLGEADLHRGDGALRGLHRALRTLDVLRGRGCRVGERAGGARREQGGDERAGDQAP